MKHKILDLLATDTFGQGLGEWEGGGGRWCPKGAVKSIRSDEGPMLETSAFNLFTVANLPYQLS